MARKPKKEEAIEVKKIESGKFSSKEVIMVALLAIIFGLLLGSFIVYNKYNPNKEAKENSDSIRYVYNSILKDYYGDVDEDALLDGALEGMINSLDDKYAAYFKPTETLQFNQALNGNFVGLGVRVGLRKDGKIEIIKVKEDSPASKAGMMVGDIILSMDGVEYNETNYSDMLYSIQSSENGTNKKFLLQRGDDTVNVVAILDTIEITTVGSYVHEESGKKIGVIVIASFSSNTYSQFLVEYEKLKKEGISSLIIDLRNNNGGYLSTAQSIASHFVDKGAVLYKKTNGKKTETTVNERDKDIDLPVILIINKNTASSAEVFASSLYDNLNVDIVGTTSYGKGTVQKLVSLNNGSSLKYTVYEWLTAKGNKIDGIGVKPTIEIEYDGTSNDNQLNEAIKIALSK